MKPLAIAVLAAALAGAMCAPPSPAQEAAGLADTVEKKIEAHRRAQAALDAWITEKAELDARRQTAAAHIDYLEKRRKFEEDQVRALTAAIDGLERQLLQFRESIDRHEHLADTLAVVVSRLDGFVSADLPFHLDERRTRIADVRVTLVADSVTEGEKLRRVFELLDAEAQYASNVELFPANVRVAGREISAEILRVGRLSLFWRSGDGKRVGEYDRVARSWVELPSEHARDIARAMEMASGARKTEIVLLPLGKVQP